MKHNNNDYFVETATVGSFTPNADKSYNDGLAATLESIQSTFNVSPISEIGSLLRHSNRADQYNRKLLEGYQALLPDDPYYSLHYEKAAQLLENSNYEILKESSIAALAPVVGLTGPVLVKSYTESVAKDIVMTEVATQPVIRKSFERKFLKDRAGKKYYVPEIFYNGKWKEISEKSKGKAFPDTAYPSGGTLQANGLNNFNLLGEAGGSIEKRDTLSPDLHIKAVIMELATESSGNQDTEVPVNIMARLDDNHISHQHVVGIGTDSGKTRVEDEIMFKVDWYNGTVTVASLRGKVKQVKFGGHLSNQNNTEVIEIDRERENFTWNMEEGTRINTGITIEKIKDMRAIANLDYTTEMVNDMSAMITSFEDADIISQLKGTLDKWLANKGDFPLGYEDGFVDQIKFKCIPTNNTLLTTTEYLGKELQYTVTKFINNLKNKIKETDLMFVMHGHPESVDIALADIDWIMTPDTQIAGLQMGYKFGIKTNNGTRIHVVSTLMERKEDGITLTAYATTENVFTFKNWKYSMNIENIYRNPLTPNTPNLMGVSRYKFASLLPVQGQILLDENKYGLGSIPV